MTPFSSSQPSVLIVRWSVAACLFVFVILITLMATLIHQAREAARGMSCSNNLRQIGIAFHNYHAAFDQLPPGCGGTGPTLNDDWSNQRRLSSLVACTPFVESTAIWELISNPYMTGERSVSLEPEPKTKNGGFNHRLNELAGNDGPVLSGQRNYFFPSMGPAPWRAKDYPPWQLGMPTYHCPSDGSHPTKGSAAFCNYASNYGDTVVGAGEASDDVPHRGAFIAESSLRWNDFTDGLANTILMMEITTYDGTRASTGGVARGVEGLAENPAGCLATVDSSKKYKPNVKLWFTRDGQGARGGNWADGAITWTGANTILPPNSPNCGTHRQGRLEGVYSASSHHPGGCFILMGDGSVVFKTDAIDTGDLSVSPPTSATEESPYGVWGNLGARASNSSGLVVGAVGR